MRKLHNQLTSTWNEPDCDAAASPFVVILWNICRKVFFSLSPLFRLEGSNVVVLVGDRGGGDVWEGRRFEGIFVATGWLTLLSTPCFKLSLVFSNWTIDWDLGCAGTVLLVRNKDALLWRVAGPPFGSDWSEDCCCWWWPFLVVISGADFNMAWLSNILIQ